MQLLHKMTMDGWPKERREVPKQIQAYWTFKEEISFTSGLLFKLAKVIVPCQVLMKIHESHLGVVKCKERARDVLYWPNMATQIEEFVSQCPVCNTHKNSNPKEPMISHLIPGRPWSKMGTGLFHFNGSNNLLSIDYYSKFPEISKLSDTTVHEAWNTRYCSLRQWSTVCQHRVQ